MRSFLRRRMALRRRAEDVEVKTWEDIYGVPEEELETWRKIGFSAPSAWKWIKRGFAPEGAAAWIAWGFNVDEAYEWSQYFPPDEAYEWREYGFTPSEAAKYYDEGYAPDKAAEARKASRRRALRLRRRIL